MFHVFFHVKKDFCFNTINQTQKCRHTVKIDTEMALVASSPTFELSAKMHSTHH